MQTFRLVALGVIVMAITASCNPPKAQQPEAAKAPPAKPPAAKATAPGATVKAPAPTPPVTTAGATLAVLPDVPRRLARQPLVNIDFAEALVPAEHRQTLKKIVLAAQIMDTLFLRQVDETNPTLRAQLVAGGAARPELRPALELFDLMYGPWDRLDENRPFIGDRARPKGASFYPTSLTGDALRAHVEAHPEQRAAFESYFTVVREQAGVLTTIPYSKYYQADLERAAVLLEEAAAASPDARLQRFLRQRAKAFRTNDYYESDMAWMDLGDSPIEVVIGPYEVYEDGLMGAKAAFEAFVCLRDPKASAQLATIMKAVPLLEKELPLPAKYTVGARGKESPLSVVVEVFTAGDTRAGVQTLAFNLPNDERVRQAKGSKKVLLRNVAEAKFSKILLPIAQQLLATEQLADVTFDAFFNHTLLHETAHGLGPGILTLPDGTQTDVNRQLRDLYSVIEEAKADMLGLWGSHLLVDQGTLPKSLERPIYASTLAGFFRSVRFGAHEAHGKANLIQFNWMLRHGGISQDPDGRFRVHYDRIRKVCEDLVRALLIIEAEGSYAQAAKLIEEYGKMPASLERALTGLQGVPVDIRPNYPITEKMKTW